MTFELNANKQNKIKERYEDQNEHQIGRPQYEPQPKHGSHGWPQNHDQRQKWGLERKPQRDLRTCSLKARAGPFSLSLGERAGVRASHLSAGLPPYLASLCHRISAAMRLGQTKPWLFEVIATHRAR